MRRVLIGGTLAALLAGAAEAAVPREVVGHIADQIAANYFDEERAAKLAGELKAEAARGAYDRYAAPLDLAEALTMRLRSQDAHFQVAWSQPAPPRSAPAAAGAATKASPEAAERRQNYGFRGVEILPAGLAVVRMSYFADIEDDAAKQAADAVMALTAGAEAVIFDLRENIGGSPSMVAYLVAHFVPDGAKVYNTFRLRGPDEDERPTAQPKTGRRLKQPIYVLTSGRTASAGESFAYTLQAAKRATVVGEASAGGANPGNLYPAGDGFSVFVSDGSPVNPITGKNWEGTGVIPDVAASVPGAVARAQQLALAKLATEAADAGARTEAQWALAALGPAVPVKALGAYVGEYGARSLVAKGGRLEMLQGRRPPLRLKPLSRDTFAVEDAAVPTRISFDRDRAGRITGMVQTVATGQMSRYARGK